MIDLFKMIVTLSAISIVAALLLAMTNAKTEDRIARHQIAAQQEALHRFMPPGAVISEQRTFLPATQDSLTYWTAVTGDDTLYSFIVHSRGYSGMIHFLVCTSTGGVITGLTVLEQSETPGRGNRIQEVLSRRSVWNLFGGPAADTVPWFSEQFTGISINKPIIVDKTSGEWHEIDKSSRQALMRNNSITAITGSTISTRAIANGLSAKAREYLKAIRG